MTQTPENPAPVQPPVPARKLALDQVVASGGRGGGVTFLPRTMQECLDFATIMSKSDFAIPPPFRNNPGACLAVTIQSCRWEADPFGVIQKAYITTSKGGDQRLAYEAQLVAAVVNTRANLAGRLELIYSGEGASRRVKVIGTFADTGEKREIDTPPVSKIHPKNSPLWTSDPDQQLAYYGQRSWGRRWCPEVLLGIYTPEELEAEVIDRNAPRPTRQDAIAETPIDDGIVRAPEPEPARQSEDVIAEAEALVPEPEEAAAEEPQPEPVVDNSDQPISGGEAARMDEMRQGPADDEEEAEVEDDRSAAFVEAELTMLRAVETLQEPDLRTEKDFDDFGDRVKAGIKEAAGLTDDERDDLRARFVSAFLNRKRDLGFGRARR